MLLLQWGAIFLASALAIFSARQASARRLILFLLAFGYILALFHKQLDLMAAIPLLLLILSAVLVRNGAIRYWVSLGHAMSIILGLTLAFHLVPGFHNPRVWGPEKITDNAAPFAMYLNLDKPLIGFWVLLACTWTERKVRLRITVDTAAVCASFAATLCLGLAWSMGLVGINPKLPTQSWLWAINNLLLVCFAEEAFFRAYLQDGLVRLLPDFKYKDDLVITGIAILFGLVHYASGWHWMLVATVAGIFFGAAYKFGGLRAAIFSHFGLNVVHFFFFTYPMTSPHLR
ncbi:CPBP family intramembrane metalloprotease [Herbaspirillum frisingense]|uniref:CPBP family intramembrane glutamic endopeptidase n=1 Tax=Herbaspirillum frisingense TaxID=92645 RepID=UPI0016048767|nr:CPBP family intramembrane glutamic endopeptidase [Herbaspirillum frisingense]QNB06097.1 CPBP family intramembrane metalloprotease [Herbaspirillum frisingense]